MSSGLVSGEVEELAWQVRLQSAVSDQPVFCSGVIFTSYLILTAAHCFTRKHDKGGLLERPYGRVRVVAGLQSGTIHGNLQGIQRLEIASEPMLHEEYDVDSLQHDIALLHLKSPINFTSHIKSGLIANVNVTQELSGDAVLSRYISAGRGSEHLDQIRVRLNTARECLANWGQAFLDGMMCGSEEGGEICKWDEGGPLTCTNKPNQGNQQKQLVCGILSFIGSGPGDEATEDCRRVTDQPSVYTQVSKYYKWILHKSCPFFREGNSCPPKYVQCCNKLCVPEDSRCDGFNDCGDDSDEQNCNLVDNQIEITGCPIQDVCPTVSTVFTAISPKFIYPFSIYRIGIFLQPGIQPQNNYTFTAWIQSDKHRPKNQAQLDMKQGEAGQLELEVEDLEAPAYALMLKVTDANDDTFYFRKDIATGQNMGVLIHTDKFVYSPQQNVHFRINFFKFPATAEHASATVWVSDPQGTYPVDNDFEIEEGQIISQNYLLPESSHPGIWNIIVNTKIDLGFKILTYNFSTKFAVQPQHPQELFLTLNVPKNIITSESTKLDLNVSALYVRNGEGVVGKATVELSIYKENCASHHLTENSEESFSLPKLEFEFDTSMTSKDIDFAKYLTKDHENGAVLEVKVTVVDSKTGQSSTKTATVQISRYNFTIAAFGANNFKRPNLPFIVDLKMVDLQNKPIQPTKPEDEIRVKRNFEGSLRFKSDGVEVKLESESLTDGLVIEANVRGITYAFEVPRVETEENNSIQIRLTYPISVKNEILPGAELKLHVMATAPVRTVHIAIFCNGKIVSVHNNELQSAKNDFEVSTIYPSNIGQDSQLFVFTYIDSDFVSDFLNITSAPMLSVSTSVSLSEKLKFPSTEPGLLSASKYSVELGQIVDISFKAPVAATSVYLVILEESCLQGREYFFTSNWLERELESSYWNCGDGETSGISLLKQLGMTVQSNAPLQNPTQGESACKPSNERRCGVRKRAEQSPVCDTWLSKTFLNSGVTKTTLNATQKISSWILTGYYILNTNQMGFFPKIPLKTHKKLFYISSNLPDKVEIAKYLKVPVFIHNHLPGTESRDVTLTLKPNRAFFISGANPSNVSCAPDSITKTFITVRVLTTGTIQMHLLAQTESAPVEDLVKEITVIINKTKNKTEDISIRKTGLVSGSEPVGAEEFPYQVRLQTDTGNEGQFCAGAILTPNLILTAAHCFKRAENDIIIVRDYSTVDVLAGVQSQKIVTHLKGSIQWLKIASEPMIHEEYEPNGYVNDIALLQLKSNIIFTSYIESALIPTKEMALNLSDKAVVSGWGYVPENQTKTSDELRKANVTVYSASQCLSYWGEKAFLPGMMCASGVKGEACQGDSGGPLTCVHQHHPGKKFACGIVSFGSGDKKANTEDCGTKTRERPGIYTDVSKYYKWILNKSCRLRAENPCPDGHIRCCNNLCVPKKSRCDGFNDCGDNSDEQNCNMADKSRAKMDHCGKQDECSTSGGIFTAVSPKFIFPFSSYRIGIFTQHVKQSQEKYTITPWINSEKHRPDNGQPLDLKQGEAGQLELRVEDLESQFYTLMLKVTDANDDTFYFSKDIATGQNISVLIHTDKFIYSPRENVYLRINYIKFPIEAFGNGSLARVRVRDPQGNYTMDKELEITEGQIIDETFFLNENSSYPGIWKIIVDSDIQFYKKRRTYNFTANFTVQPQQHPEISLSLNVPKYIITSESTKLHLNVSALYVRNGEGVVGEATVELSIAKPHCAGYQATEGSIFVPKLKYDIDTLLTLNDIEFGSNLTEDHDNGAMLQVKVTVVDSKTGHSVTEIATVQISWYNFTIAAFGLSSSKRPNLPFVVDLKMVDLDNKPIESLNETDEKLCVQRNFKGSLNLRNGGVQFYMESDFLETSLNNLNYKYKVPEVETEEKNSLQIRLIEPASVNNEVTPGAELKVGATFTAPVETVHILMSCNGKVTSATNYNHPSQRKEFEFFLPYPDKICRDPKLAVFTYIDDEFVSDFLSLHTKTAEAPKLAETAFEMALGTSTTPANSSGLMPGDSRSPPDTSVLSSTSTSQPQLQQGDASEEQGLLSASEYRVEPGDSVNISFKTPNDTTSVYILLLEASCLYGREDFFTDEWLEKELESTDQPCADGELPGFIQLKQLGLTVQTNAPEQKSTKGEKVCKFNHPPRCRSGKDAGRVPRPGNTWMSQTFFFNLSHHTITEVAPQKLSTWILTGYYIRNNSNDFLQFFPKSLLKTQKHFYITCNLPDSVDIAEYLEVPVFVHNHLPGTQSRDVTVTLKNSKGAFELDGEATQGVFSKVVSCLPHSITKTIFRVRAVKIGTFFVDLDAKTETRNSSVSKQINVNLSEPPFMLKQPSAGDILFNMMENSEEAPKILEIVCEAGGHPKPTFSWLKNGRRFNWKAFDDRMSLQDGQGTLLIQDPRDEDIGHYQCLANNKWGTAAANPVFVHKRYVNDFESQQTLDFTAEIGFPFKLPCSIPDTWPEVNFDWMLENFNGPIKSINSSRMTVDPRGHLCFSNVTAADASLDFYYTCAIFPLRDASAHRTNYRLGNRVFLKVTSDPSSKYEHAPVFQYTSKANANARKGQNVDLWCIAAGTPLPRIKWSKKDGNLPANRTRFENFGKRLRLEGVELSDEGTYECRAENGRVPTLPALTHSIRLSVFYPPDWIVQPKKQTAAEGDVVEFTCEATGKPPPEIKWLVNGTTLFSQLIASPRWKIMRNKIRIENVSKEDGGNFACNASNAYGQLYKDVSLTVMSVPAQILEPPGYRVSVDGVRAVLTCRVFGSPTPTLVWTRDGKELEGSRYRILDNGDLAISDVTKDDAGNYTCSVNNRFGSEVQNETLLVKNHTIITQPPQHFRIGNQNFASFSCAAVADSDLKLTVDWLWNNNTINFTGAQHYTKWEDNSLTISQVQDHDLGVYTCLAWTELDQVRADANLIGNEKPYAPQISDLSCRRYAATIVWRSGGDNRPEVSNYTIQCHISHSPKHWQVDVEGVSAQLTSLTLRMRPWAIYMFRVVAWNKMGPSEPSAFSHLCLSPPDIPSFHPYNVKGHGTQPDNLVISWTPVPEMEQNGPNFRYVVQWKAQFDSTELEPVDWIETEISDWRVSNLTIHDQPTYRPYLIRVLSRNEEGLASEDPIEVKGYSGQNKPLAAPRGFSLSKQVDYKTVMVSWNSVSEESIRGKFESYKIEHWTKGKAPENILVDNNLTKTTVGNLVPVVRNYLRIRVCNTDYEGPPSETIEVVPEEGLPGQVDVFEALPLGHNAFYLSWKEPQFPNGILIGYEISYEKEGENGTDHKTRLPSIDDSERTSAKLFGLETNTTYRIEIFAKTRIGLGKGYSIIETTNSILDKLSDKANATQTCYNPFYPTNDEFAATAQVLVKPMLSWSGLLTQNGTSRVRVHWRPDLEGEGRHGANFYVQYRLFEEETCRSKQPVLDDLFQDVTDLKPGQVYLLRIAVVDGQLEQFSDTQGIYTRLLNDNIILNQV